jgi:RNA polymerase sigma factor (sigma-70 family)
VGIFRTGNDDAFRVIHDRYRVRLLAYIRQMLAGAHPDAEDVLQDVFVRAYAGLQANGRELSLRPWLYRIAHNRCVDELRRPLAPAPEQLEVAPSATNDPVLEAEKRESLRRLIIDIRRLPDQQRSALLMREMSGMAYTEIGGVLGLSVPAVKSLLVRARVGLSAAGEARDTACHQIRSELAEAHERGVRSSGLARRHLHDCPGCREYRSELRGVSRQLAALTPVLGPLGVLARLIGVGSGGGAAAGGTGSGMLAAGGAASAGSTVLGAAATHVAAVVAAAVVTAGGAVEIQKTVATQLDPAPAHHVKRATGVGQGTSVEGNVAASAAVPLHSYAPAPVQPAPAPAVPAPQRRPVSPRKRSAKVNKVSAPAAAPSRAATDTSAATSAPAPTDSTAPSAGAPSCESASPAVPAPASATSSPPASAPGTAAGTSGAPPPPSPGSSPGPASPPPSSGATCPTSSSVPTSGASAGTGPASPQAQSS